MPIQCDVIFMPIFVVMLRWYQVFVKKYKKTFLVNPDKKLKNLITSLFTMNGSRRKNKREVT